MLLTRNGAVIAVFEVKVRINKDRHAQSPSPIDPEGAFDRSCRNDLRRETDSWVNDKARGVQIKRTRVRASADKGPRLVTVKKLFVEAADSWKSGLCGFMHAPVTAETSRAQARLPRNHPRRSETRASCIGCAPPPSATSACWTCGLHR